MKLRNGSSVGDCYMGLAGMRNYCMGRVAVVGCRVAVGLGIVGFHVDLIDDALERISFEKK